MSQRRQNFQNVSWFWDIMKNGKLNLDPPYQRRSVWSPRYRETFIDTLLLDYPAPAIFLFPAIDATTGESTYELVDGKQRLTSIFDFLEDKFVVAEQSPSTSLRGLYFSQLPTARRVAFYEYDFSVEYLPTNNEDEINNIFDRLNRNVSKLTPQELRHAKFDGQFISTAERLADWMRVDFDSGFPRIAPSSRRQMKDVELIATLLLLLEEGARGYSLTTLDAAFSTRDEEWADGDRFEQEFRDIIEYLREVRKADEASLDASRFRNQADFYSLIGALAFLARQDDLPNPSDAHQYLVAFASQVDDEDTRDSVPAVRDYFEAARSASNDAAPREVRIRVVRRVLAGEDLMAESE